MYRLFKTILFKFDAEKAHNITTKLLRALMKIPFVKVIVSSTFKVNNPSLSKNLFGLQFPNPVGLAAGFDKNAAYMHEFEAFGFGFIEIGTITPKAQPGNPQPRLFRLPEDQALINRMGFNNEGMEVAVEKLKKRPKNLIIGGNIGKNKITPNENATDDYVKCFDTLHPLVDYFVVNVSSPNTPDLRALQDKEPLKKLLITLQHLNNEKNPQKPILLKIAPDLNDSQLDDIIEIIEEIKLDGLIATNTTIERSGLNSSEDKLQTIGAGGLSGAPLRKRSTEVIRYIKNRLPSLPIIGVGGIIDEGSALEKLDAGADLLQIYTGFIYEGPALIKRINKAILQRVEQG